MKEKIAAYAFAIGRFILRKVLVFDLIILILVGLSFFIWKGFTPAAFSERLVWTGIGIAMIAGILTFSQTSGGRDFGVPGQFISPTHAATMFEWNREIRRDIERRFDFRFQTFLIGLILFLVGILVQVIFD